MAKQKSLSNRQNLHPVSRLYIVATPIGNLEDLSPRALRTLQECDEIWCEDTRVAMTLCRALGVEPKKLLRLDHHISAADLGRLTQRLQEHALSVAFLSDAGTPGVQDPGTALIRDIRSKSLAVEIISIPGPSAVTAAVSLLGARSGNFSFLGYFPRDRKTANECLISSQPRAGSEVQVFFESPERIQKTVQFWASWFLEHEPTRNFRFWLVKELTKVYERVIELDGPKALQAWADEVSPEELRGEWVIAFEALSDPIAKPEPLLAISDAWIAAMLTHGVSARDAAEIAHKACGVPNNIAYRQALDRKKSG